MTALLQRDCPVCGSQDRTYQRVVRDQFTHEPFKVQQCLKCTCLYLSPAPSPTDIGAYYDTPFGVLMRKSGGTTHTWLRSFAFALETRPLLKSLRPTDSIMDFGCGDGSLTSYLFNKGWNVTGCDLLPLQNWTHPSVPYIAMSSMTSPPSFKGYKAVIMRHVLEHLHEPTQFLATLHEAGVERVLILVPNAASPFRKWFGEYWSMWEPPRHLTFFTSKTLDIAAQHAGFSSDGAADHGFDEIITSLLRWRLLSSRTTIKPGVVEELPRALQILSPKGLLCALSSAVAAPLTNSVLVRCYRKQSAP